jgi:hypothetical protein
VLPQRTCVPLCFSKAHTCCAVSLKAFIVLPQRSIVRHCVPAKQILASLSCCKAKHRCGPLCCPNAYRCWCVAGQPRGRCAYIRTAALPCGCCSAGVVLTWQGGLICWQLSAWPVCAAASRQPSWACGRRTGVVLEHPRWPAPCGSCPQGGDLAELKAALAAVNKHRPSFQCITAQHRPTAPPAASLQGVLSACRQRACAAQGAGGGVGSAKKSESLEGERCTCAGGAAAGRLCGLKMPGGHERPGSRRGAGVGGHPVAHAPGGFSISA